MTLSLVMVFILGMAWQTCSKKAFELVRQADELYLTRFPQRSTLVTTNNTMLWMLMLIFTKLTGPLGLLVAYIVALQEKVLFSKTSQ